MPIRQPFRSWLLTVAFGAALTLGVVGDLTAQIGGVLRGLDKANDARRAAEAVDAAAIADKAAKAARFVPGVRVVDAFDPAARVGAGAGMASSAWSVFCRLDEPSEFRLAYLGAHAEGATLVTNLGRSETHWSAASLMSAPADIVRALGDDPFRPAVLVVEKGLLDERRISLTDIPSDVKLMVIDPQGRGTITMPWVSSGRVERFASVDGHKSLLYDIHQPVVVGRLSSLFAEPFSARDVGVLTLVDEHAYPRTIGRLKEVTGRHAVQSTILATVDVEEVIRQARGKMLIVVGHNEGEQFVIRGADNSVRGTIARTTLEALAEQSKVELIFLSCQTGRGGIAAVLDGADAAGQLDRALGAASYGAFFAGLGTAENPFVVSASQVDKGIQLVVERLDRRHQAGTVVHGARLVVHGARLVRPRRSDSGSSILWWIGGVIVVLYFLGRAKR